MMIARMHACKAARTHTRMCNLKRYCFKGVFAGVILTQPVPEQLTLLDAEQADAAIFVTDCKHLAVGPPRQARHRVVEACVRNEPIRHMTKDGIGARLIELRR